MSSFWAFFLYLPESFSDLVFHLVFLAASGPTFGISLSTPSSTLSRSGREGPGTGSGILGADVLGLDVTMGVLTAVVIMVAGVGRAIVAAGFPPPILACTRSRASHRAVGEMGACTVVLGMSSSTRPRGLFILPAPGL